MDLICPNCGGNVEECHPFSSDAGAYWQCDKCGDRYEEYELDELMENQP
jgi:predicted RNA-binding Zn-ribbon protein involved in translation (DUF1610 family)